VTTCSEGGRGEKELRSARLPLYSGWTPKGRGKGEKAFALSFFFPRIEGERKKVRPPPSSSLSSSQLSYLSFPRWRKKGGRKRNSSSYPSLLSETGGEREVALLDRNFPPPAKEEKRNKSEPRGPRASGRENSDLLPSLFIGGGEGGVVTTSLFPLLVRLGKGASRYGDFPATAPAWRREPRGGGGSDPRLAQSGRERGKVARANRAQVFETPCKGKKTKGGGLFNRCHLVGAVNGGERALQRPFTASSCFCQNEKRKEASSQTFDVSGGRRGMPGVLTSCLLDSATKALEPGHGDDLAAIAAYRRTKEKEEKRDSSRDCTSSPL